VTKRSVCVVITARPSYSRIKTALQAIAAHPALELHLVVAASALLDRYGNAVKVIESDGFEIAARVFMVLEGESPTSMAKTTGIGLIELATAFDNLRPDVVVTVASYMNVPVAHVQGGEVSGSIDEKVRHAVTKLSDIHFVASKLAAERVQKMGEHASSIFITGCPSIDLARDILTSPALGFDPVAKYGGVGAPLDLSQGYLVVMQHPVTTEHHLARKHVTETLHAVHETGMPTLWFWPNVDAGSDGTSNGIRAFRESQEDTSIHFFKNMVPDDFLRLIYNARCLIGNSSVGIRESGFLGVPVVNIGGRQGGRERSHNVVDVGYDRREISAAIRQQTEHGRYASDLIYGDGSAGQRIADLLAEVPLRVEKRLAY
jgi:UDP-hydrolysing UDP-N-acetyl-D-glucosamine 2-epimerase